MDNGDVLKRHARMAYMDGELLLSDRVAFEKSLTPQQKRLIAIDKAVQSGLVGCLNRLDQCPEALWDRAKGEIGRPHRSPRIRWFVPLSAVAAAFVLAVGLFYVNLGLSKPLQYEVDLPADAQQYADSASIKGNQASIEEILHERGFDVDIRDIATYNEHSPHHVTLLGANMVTLGKWRYPCAHLCFSCCGQPVMTFVVKESPRITLGSFRPSESSAKGQGVWLMDRHVNGYLIVTMSSHRANVVASLFEKPTAGREN